MSTTATFSRDGVRFQYPTNWALEVEAGSPDGGDAGWTATVQSPGTAFVVVSLRPDADTPGRLADEALAALAAEYPGLESDPAVGSLGGLPAVGHDFDFLAVDAVVTGWTRCVETGAGPLLVLCQVAQYDKDANGPVLHAVSASVEVDE